MKFYIVSGIAPSVCCSLGDAYFYTNNIDIAISKFNSFSLAGTNFQYAYLIADFEIYKPNPFGYSTADIAKDTIPFLIIGEYTLINNVENRFIRNDTLCIKSAGFVEEFSNNETAMRKFIEFYEGKKNCTFTIRYLYDSNGKEESFEAVIATTPAIYKLSKPYSIKKVMVKPWLWSPDPTIKERKFSKKEYIENFASTVDSILSISLGNVEKEEI